MSLTEHNNITMKCNEEMLPQCAADLATISADLKSLNNFMKDFQLEHAKVHEDIKESMELYNKYLFVGNGVPPIATRIDRLENDKSGRDTRHTWYLGIVSLVLAGVVLFVAQDFYTRKVSPQPSAQTTTSNKP